MEVYWVLLKWLFTGDLRIIRHLCKCFVCLEAFSRNIGPNNFPSLFSYFCSDSGFREALILDQANFLRSTFIEWYVLPTIHRALCSFQTISSFVGLEVGFNKSHNKHVRRPVTSNNSSRRLYKQHSISYCGWWITSEPADSTFFLVFIIADITSSSCHVSLWHRIPRRVRPPLGWSWKGPCKWLKRDD